MVGSGRFFHGPIILPSPNYKENWEKEFDENCSSIPSCSPKLNSTFFLDSLLYVWVAYFIPKQ